MDPTLPATASGPGATQLAEPIGQGSASSGLGPKEPGLPLTAVRAILGAPRSGPGGRAPGNEAPNW